MMRLAVVATVFVMTLGVGFIYPSVEVSAEAGAPTYEGENGLAIAGYDVVAYARTGNAVQGKMRYRSRYNGSVYAFASVEHQQAFGADPVRYLPAYGGYCSYGVRLGRKSPIDPSIFEVVDGKLHFFMNRATKFAWDEHRSNNKKIADKNWQKMAHRL